MRGPTPTATLGSQHCVSLWVMPPRPCTPVFVHAPPSWGTAASQLHHHKVSAVPCPQAVWMHSMRQPLQELIMCGSDHGSSRRLGGPGPTAMERWPINRMCISVLLVPVCACWQVRAHPLWCIAWRRCQQLVWLYSMLSCVFFECLHKQRISGSYRPGT